jgi:hypothetical protein
MFIVIASSVILFGGGRIVSSDETSTFLTIESIIRYGKLDIPVNSPAVTMHDGKAYSWYEPGNMIAGMPLYLAGYATAKVLPVSPVQVELLLRAAVSCTSALLAGWLAIMFYGFCRAYLLERRRALAMTIALIFGSFLFPYFKTFLKEPLLILCLLGGVRGVWEAVRTSDSRRPLIRAGMFLGYGILTKLVFVVSVIPVLVYLVVEMNSRERSFKQKSDDLLAFGIPILLVGFGGNGLYNILRFGNPFTLGYSSGTSFTTPLITGLFGLLLSPGKGLFWFAPICILLLWAFKPFWQVNRREASCIAGIVALNLIMYGLYTAWGGDGSWGPRYLAPLVPLLLLPVAVYFEKAKPLMRRITAGLIVLGVLVQIGGTAVYAGSYLREIQEYPYQKSFDDPEFLYRAHFIPDFSPIIGHWKLLLRNGGEHLRGEYPRISLTSAEEGGRLPIEHGDQEKLSHMLDFWFTYALYSGFSGAVVLGLFMPLLLLVGVSIVFLRRAYQYERTSNV